MAMSPKRAYAPRDTALGKKLTELREAKKMTQQDLAKAIGCSLRALISWERGHATPMPVFKKAIDKFFKSKLPW